MEEETSRDDEEADELFAVASRNDATRLRMHLIGQHDVSKRVSPDHRNSAGETLALVCARQGRVACCAALLDAGADPMERDADPHMFGDGVWPDEQKPLDLFGVPVTDKGGHAQRSGRTVIYHLRAQGLLEQMLDQVFPMTRVHITMAISKAVEDFHMRPALLFAARRNQPQLLDLLVSHSVARPLDVISGPSGSTHGSRPASRPATSSPRSVCSAISHNATGLRPPPHGERAEALLAACLKENWECASIVIKRGRWLPPREIEAKRDKLGRTVLHLAAMGGAVTVVRQLLEAGVSPQIFSNIGRQPLHDASTAGKADTSAALLDFADPRLRVAMCEAEVKDLVGSMDAQGRPKNNKDAGRNPFQLALARGHHNVCALLKARGIEA